MTVHLYTQCWDEADVLPFFFRHYDGWVDRYVVYDDGSTDGSLDLLHAHDRVEVRSFERAVPDSFVASQVALYDSVWKESRGTADWVVITAIDEHLWLRERDIRSALAMWSAEGVTALPAVGYQMIADALPRSYELLCRTKTRGAPWKKMNKLSLFAPDALHETRYTPGRHRGQPTGIVRYPERDELLNLHYKYLGFERLAGRHARLAAGLGPADVARNWGNHYSWSLERLRAEWRELERRAVDVADRAIDPIAANETPRWWRTTGPG